MLAVTLRDIAKRLNLSPSLVSGVLNGREGVWASEKTRARVLQAAQEAGYRPNAAARALRSGRSNTIALVYIYTEQEYYRTGYVGITETLADELGKIGYQLLVKAFTEPEALLDGLTEMVRSRTCDGVVLWGREADVEAQGNLLASLSFPFVVKGRHETAHPDWLQAEYDHEAMMTRAMEHLASLGHERIAYLGFDFEETFCTRLREGFVQAVIDQTGSAPLDLFLSAEGTTTARTQAQMTFWLQLPPQEQPTALVIGASDAAWCGVEIALASVGRCLGETPPDFAVAGVGSMEIHLLFGQGHVLTANTGALAASLMVHLLTPLLQNTPIKNNIVRLLPPLLPAASLQLQRYVTLPALTF